MNSISVKAEPLTPESFERYGEVIRQPCKATDQDFPAYKYWDRIESLDFSGCPAELAYVRMFHRPFWLTSMERHRKATQTFIPFGSAPGVVVVAPGNPDDPDEQPDASKVRAFFLDGRAGYHLKRGTWHQSMFPIGEVADYIMVVRRNNIVDDQQIRELKARVVITI